MNRFFSWKHTKCQQHEGCNARQCGNSSCSSTADITLDIVYTTCISHFFSYALSKGCQVGKQSSTPTTGSPMAACVLPLVSIWSHCRHPIQIFFSPCKKIILAIWKKMQMSAHFICACLHLVLYNYTERSISPLFLVIFLKWFLHNLHVWGRSGERLRHCGACNKLTVHILTFQWKY